ncbi:MAG: SDR family NAD(P)-dependent oxidoreductase [Prolixibacteraceae bacterium]|nr:SDR family NAD(P)-dependent oxidoreductase [Prolixibacteraceae bacterium]
MEKEIKYALVTGASMGLGKSFAEELASRGKNLIIVSLENEGLQTYGAKLEKKYGINVICYEANLAKHNEVFQLAEWVNSKYEVDLLINNAGIGGTGDFFETSYEHIDTIIQLNIRAVSQLVKLMVPNLSRQSGAYILNVASMASFCPIPLKTVYPASKVFVYFFSRSIYYELKRKNIHVSVLHPGPMKTNPDVSRNIDFQGIIGKMGLLPTSKLARIAITALYYKQAVIVPGFLNKITWLLMKVLPVKLQLYLGDRITQREIKWEKTLGISA